MPESGSVLLFLDVDGTLLPFATAAGPPATANGNPLLDGLNPAYGRWLLALGCDLVWATGWMDEANTEISPRIGLPAMPVVDFPDFSDDWRTGLHWKTRYLVAWAAGRPFIWLDDELTDIDRAWVNVHHPAPALLHQVSARAGLTETDMAALKCWLTDLK
jgi:HAD domain in Swiss Army Knife RNA repair proteins